MKKKNVIIIININNYQYERLISIIYLIIYILIFTID